MKSLVIFFGTLLFTYTLYAQGITISGKIKVTPQEQSKELLFSKILIVNEAKVIGSASVDTSCYFKVNLNEIKGTSSNIHADIYMTIVHDTLYIKPITLIPNSVVNCDIELPTKYNKNVLGDVICPRCNRTNDVVPIRRGCQRKVEMHIKNGDTTYTPSSKEYFISGDVTYEFEAEWYCKKCKIKF